MASTGHVAVRALGRSVLINMVAPGVVYSIATSRFAPGSLYPLALSGLPPMLWLAYGWAKLRAVDWLGAFAAENVVVRIVALALAHTERGALIGRSSENVVLALVFLGSLRTEKPMMFYLTRQLATGNDPAKREGFDCTSTPAVLAPYRTLTAAWSFALVIKAGGSFALATTVSTSDFLVLSPLGTCLPTPCWSAAASHTAAGRCRMHFLRLPRFTNSPYVDEQFSSDARSSRQRVPR